MLQKTLAKFGYPDSLVKEYAHWILLARDEQLTLGSLILVSKEEVVVFPKLSEQSFCELHAIMKEIEAILESLFTHDRINYLAFMMFNPLVHMSIIPRYANDRVFNGIVFKDRSWPGLPNFTFVNPTDKELHRKITLRLASAFNKTNTQKKV